jgi:hypothetical protein
MEITASTISPNWYSKVASTNNPLSYSYEQALQAMRSLRLPYPDALVKPFTVTEPDGLHYF